MVYITVSAGGSAQTLTDGEVVTLVSGNLVVGGPNEKHITLENPL